jgi:hypothetical protein
VLAVDDELQRPHWSARMKMPRELLAQLAVHCLLLADEGAWRAAQGSLRRRACWECSTRVQATRAGCG